MPPADRAAILASVRGQLEDLTILVGDLVDLARPGGRALEAPEDLRLDALVQDAVERARRHAPATRSSVTTEPCMVSGSRGRLARAVGNLLDNAVKWSPPGSPVEVAVAAGEVTVRDHGPGIAEDDLPHVFDRFYRAPAARGLPGSGLGPGHRQARRRRARRHRRRRAGARRRCPSAPDAAPLTDLLTRSQEAVRLAGPHVRP